MKEENTRIFPVILVGGQGTRLWPLSRSERPKQFLNLVGPQTLFQSTLNRVADPKIYLPSIVITHADYRFLVLEQAEQCGAELGDILLEPECRNTAAAIAAVCKFVTKKHGDGLLHVLPSDHLISPDSNYIDAISQAREGAQAGQLVTFGVRPTFAATGYGYIKPDGEQSRPTCVKKFVEKPKKASAEKLLAQGNYFWNSGMFMFGAQSFLEEGLSIVPEIFEPVSRSVELAANDLMFTRLSEAEFKQVPSQSVDKAIFEKSEKASMVALSSEWSDLGAWEEVWKTQCGNNAASNFVLGRGILKDTTNSLVHSERDLVVVSGMTDVAVVVSEDAVFVGNLKDSESVKDIVETLKVDPETKAFTQTNKTTFRPWGGYSSIDASERYQVKRLFVKPGKKLSLQMHNHRAEHWIVVRGTARIVIDDTTKTIFENESIYLPKGCVHRLENPGTALLEIIEVQTGSYLGEDDIVRFEDDFGRL